MNKSILFIILAWIPTMLWGQVPKSFSQDDAQYIQALSTYIASNNRPQAVQVSDWLKANLLANTSASDLELIKKTTDVMLEKKVPLWPNFYNYALFLKSSIENKHLNSSIVSQNHKITLALLQENHADARRNFYFYTGYLTNHYSTQTVYQDKTKEWTSEVNYTISMENGLPVYSFPKSKLTGTTLRDSLMIEETTGKFYPFSNLWESDGGKISWRRAGYEDQNVFATFGNYQLDLANPEINIDTASLRFKPYTDEIVSGSFSDKLSTSQSVASAYPQFKSFNKVPIQIADEISLESGINLEGQRLFATATGRAEPAKMTLYNSNKELILSSEAERYYIKDFKQIDAQGVSLNFCYIDSMSIFHPSSTLSYNLENKNLKITREDKSEARIPYVAPYFSMNLYVDQFEWNTDQNYLQLNSTTAHAKLPSVFESFDYYVPGSDFKYQQLLNMDPIVALANFSESMGSDRLLIEDVARAWGAGNYKSIESLTFKMMEDGYLYYNRENGTVDLYNKLFLHAKINQEEQVNYDNIRLLSLTKGVIGKLLIDEKQLEILGVEPARLIPEGNISLSPSSDTVYISENRNLAFKGMITAGKFNFYSEYIQLDYDNYLFKLNDIDSMLIMVPLDATDSKGNQYYTEINTPITKISGNIYIGDSEDRNQSLKYTRYPYFDCNDTSIVSFNTGQFGDRYPAEEFSFKIFPFTLENLHTYDTEGIQLEGLLQSAGIFNDLETTISITKDRTLGLHFNTDGNPMPIYDNIAQIDGQVTLNNDGLTVLGTLIKKNLQFESDTILLLPDSAFASVNRWGTVESENPFYLDIQGGGADFSWDPINDSAWIVPSEKFSTVAYNSKATLDGTFHLNNNNIIQSGSMKINETSFESSDIQLELNHAEIQNTPLAIIQQSNQLLVSENADINAQFYDNQVHIQTPNDSISYYEKNALLTNYNHFTWNLDKQTIDIEEQHQNDSLYYEFTDSRLKGVKLKANNSSFDLNLKAVNLVGISQMTVADSKVIPYEQKLSITEGGQIDVLNQAEVILNTENNYHTIQNAQVEIMNEQEMKGTGTLLVNLGNEQIDVPIEHFKTIKVESPVEGKKKDFTYSYHIEGVAFTEEEDNFKLADNLKYKGKMLFSSLNPEIELDGYAKSELKTIPETDWFKINQSLDLQKTSLGIDSLKNELNQNVYTGLMLDLFDFQIYPRVLQSKENGSDRPIYTAEGYMKDEGDLLFFGNEKDLEEKDEYSNLLTYNDTSSVTQIQGEFQFLEVEPNLFNLFGKTSYTENQVEPLRIRGSLAMKLEWLQEAEKLIARFINNSHFDGEMLNLVKNKEYSHAIGRAIADEEERVLVQEDMEMSGILNLPTNYPYNVVLDGVDFTFDNYEGTFKSFEPVDMLVFAGRPFTQKIKAYIEVGARSKTDFINMYLVTANDEWLFIRYIDGEMSLVSSNSDFNTGISKLKKKENSIQAGKKIVYVITLTNPSLKDNFVGRMESFIEEQH